MLYIYQYNLSQYTCMFLPISELWMMYFSRWLNWTIIRFFQFSLSTLSTLASSYKQQRIRVSCKNSWWYQYRYTVNVLEKIVCVWGGVVFLNEIILGGHFKRIILPECSLDDCFVETGTPAASLRQDSSCWSILLLTLQEKEYKL